MLSSDQENFILQHAYIPEHIINLMVGLSQGEPFYENGYVFFVKKDVLIFIGYPLPEISSREDFVPFLQGSMQKFHPEVTWFIAPEIPSSLRNKVQEIEGDFYYILPLAAVNFSSRLLRATQKAAQKLTVAKSREFSREHILLTKEYLMQEHIPPKIKELFNRLPEYIKYSSTSLILSAWDEGGKLSAYYVLELGGRRFITYVLGGYSKENYVSHASDLLFYEMYKLAKEMQKEYIHLGLGVNEGIRRFKIKWGGIPYLPYEAGAILSKSKIYFSLFNTLKDKL
ncbi:MAG: hypothetical protein ACPL5I_08475 [Thermodesulfobacteriota bacterium]